MHPSVRSTTTTARPYAASALRPCWVLLVISARCVKTTCLPKPSTTRLRHTKCVRHHTHTFPFPAVTSSLECSKICDTDRWKHVSLIHFQYKFQWSTDVSNCVPVSSPVVLNLFGSKAPHNNNVHYNWPIGKPRPPLVTVAHCLTMTAAVWKPCPTMFLHNFGHRRPPNGN